MGPVDSAYATGKKGHAVFGDQLMKCALDHAIGREGATFRTDTVLGTTLAKDETDKSGMYTAPKMAEMLRLAMGDDGGSMASVMTGAHLMMPFTTHFFAGANAKVGTAKTTDRAAPRQDHILLLARALVV